MPDGLLEKIKAAEAAQLGGAGTSAAPVADAATEMEADPAAEPATPPASPAPDASGSLLSRLQAAEKAQTGNVSRGTQPKYRSLQPADSGVNPDIASQDLKNSTDYWTNFYLFPGVKPPEPTQQPPANANNGIDIKKLSQQIADKESAGGNYEPVQPINPKTGKPVSSATGKYQFLWGDFGDSIKQVTGVKDREEFLKNHEAQENFFQYHVKNNLEPAVKRLHSLNKPGYSDSQLARLVHFKGEAGAKEWLEARADNTKANNISVDDYLGKPEGNTTQQPQWDGFPHALPPGYKPAARNMSVDQAKQATAAEIKASQNYLGKFYQENPELQKYMTIGGLGPGQGAMDPQNGLNRVLNTGGDWRALSSFSGTAMSLIADKKKEDLAALERQYPMTGGSVSAMNEFAAPRARTNEAAYDQAKADIEKKYAEKEQNLRNSIASVAQLKVSNEYLQQHGTTKNISPADAQEVGWQYMEAVGDGKVAQRQRELFAKNQLSPAEKVEAQRLGYKALQYKMMEAASNDQKAIAENLATHVNGYQAKIRDANPEFVKQQIADAISDDINKEEYKGSVWAKVWGVHPDEEMIQTSAARLGIPREQLAGIKPSDIKAKRAGVLGQWASGLISTTAAPLYEFSMRHLLPTNDAAVEKRFDENWYDNSDVAHYVGGQALPSDALKQGATNINTDPASEEYLMNTRNAQGGQWNFDASNVIGIAATGLGNLSGFSKGIGTSAGVISKLGAGAKTAENLGLATYMYLSNFDNNMKEARAALGGDEADEAKATILANMYTMADIFGMKIVDPVKRLSPGFGKNVMGGKEFIDKLAKGGIEQISKAEIARTFAQGLKQSGINLAEMTAGMDGITAGRYLADMIMAPEKFSTQDTAEGFLESTVNAAIINAIPAIFGGFGAATSKNRMMQDALYDVGSNPRPYLDAIDANVEKGSLNPQDAAKQKQVVNTLTDIINNSVPERSLANGQPLTDAQKKEYAANLFDAAVLNAKKENVKDEVQIGHIEKYINELKGQREEILNTAGVPPPAEAAAEGEQAAAEPQGPTAQSFADRIAAGEKMTTPEDLQFYENNKAEIEKLLQEKQGAPTDAEQQAAAPEAAEETTTEPTAEDNVTVGELMDRPVTYRGEEATLVQDGQTVVVKMKEPSAEGREREYELGNIDEIKEHGIKDYGIEQQNSVVDVNDQGNITVRGKEYVNNYSDPMQAVSYDKNGNPSVSLETAEGKKRTFRGAVAEDIAYHLTLKEIEKRNEQGKLEDFINGNEEARTTIEEARREPEPVAAIERNEPGQADTGRPAEAAEGQAVGNNAGVPGGTEPKPTGTGSGTKRGKIERKAQPELFDEPASEPAKKEKEVHPDFDFEEEPTVAAKIKEKAVKTQPAPVAEAVQSSVPRTDREAQRRAGDEFVSTQRTEEEVAETRKVGGNIRAKFENNDKYLGNTHTEVLADGSELHGHYMLVPADAVTPSHDPLSGYRTSKGFPVMENGRNPNDRDYTNRENSAKVMARANSYDGRAITQMPTVDKNGVVINGNDRTMASQLAARNKTDGKYLEVLKKNAAQYGFSTEQVEAMERGGRAPRVVFVPDVVLPYNTKTFARFNPETTGKVKTSQEKATTLANTVSDDTVRRLGEEMSKFDSVVDFYNSAPSMRAVKEVLRKEGVLTNDNQAQYFDGSDITLHGKELLHNLMLGKVFGDRELKVLKNHDDIRAKMLYAMGNIMGIEAMGKEYSLKPYFDEALHLWDTVEQFKDKHNLRNMSEALDMYLRSGNMFEKFSTEAINIFHEFNSQRKTPLREFTGNYLEAAKGARENAAKGIDIFGNAPVSASREQMINEYAENKKQLEELELTRTSDAQLNDGRNTGADEQVLPATDSRPEEFSQETGTGNAGEPARTELQSPQSSASVEKAAAQPNPELMKPGTVAVSKAESRQKADADYQEFVNSYERKKAADAVSEDFLSGKVPLNEAISKMGELGMSPEEARSKLEYDWFADKYFYKNKAFFDVVARKTSLTDTAALELVKIMNPHIDAEGRFNEATVVDRDNLLGMISPEAKQMFVDAIMKTREMLKKDGGVENAPQFLSAPEERQYQAPEEPNNLVEEAAPEYGKEDPTPIPEGKELTEREQKYRDAIGDVNKYSDFIRKKDAKIAEIEAQMQDMQRNREMSTPEYEQLKKQLAQQESAKRQYELKRKAADLDVKRYEGKRMSDTIRKLKSKIADDLAFSTPGISPSHFKAMIDFVAGAVKIGEHVHDAILDAVIKFKERNPEIKFDENELTAKLEAEIRKAMPLRDASFRPQLESMKNKQLADAIIGKIKSAENPEAYKQEALQNIADNPKIADGTKDALREYIEYHTANENRNINDSKNPYPLDDYKMKTSDEVQKLVSGYTINDIFGEMPNRPQEYNVMRQADMLADGEAMLNIAQKHFGQDVMQWGPKLLDHLKEMPSDETPKKAVILATMQGRLREEMLRNPAKAGEIRKVLDATEAVWQKFIRKSSLELVAAKLLRFYRDKNISDFYTDQITSDKQKAHLKELERGLKEAGVTDEAVIEGVMQSRDEAMAEMKAQNDALQTKIAEHEKEIERLNKEGGSKKNTRKESYRKKAEEIAAKTDMKSMIDSIKEEIKKTKC